LQVGVNARCYQAAALSASSVRELDRHMYLRTLSIKVVTPFGQGTPHTGMGKSRSEGLGSTMEQLHRVKSKRSCRLTSHISQGATAPDQYKYLFFLSTLPSTMTGCESIADEVSAFLQNAPSHLRV